MDTFSQAASAFLDLQDDSETERADPMMMDISTSVSDLDDCKHSLAKTVALEDFGKKRLRPKQEENHQIKTQWAGLKKEAMSASEAELMKLDILARSLEKKAKCHLLEKSVTVKRKAKTKLKKRKKKSSEWCTSASSSSENEEHREEEEDVDSSLSSSVTSEDYKVAEFEEFDALYGCQKCALRWEGCNECKKEEPIVRRPKIRWNPNSPHSQNVPPGPIYHPTEEEFKDPFDFISSIRAEAQKFGICMIVPPKKWTSDFAPEADCEEEACHFFPKRQLVSSLCARSADNNAPINNRQYTSMGHYMKRKEDSSVSSDDEFGFTASELPFSVRSFKAFADWSHQLHFQRDHLDDDGGDKIPSVQEIEGEFWRLVDADSSGKQNEFETFYGSDLDSRKFRKMSHSATNLNTQWEVSMWPRSPRSVLKQVPGEDLITGVMVPWIYFGSTMSAFCWHVEDHALYSVNYLHAGSTKLWYGIPSFAAHDFEAALQDALPHLFRSDSQLLHRLVTHISPTQLQKRGIPVHRIEHQPGTFVVTFPNAYHGGFNCGWNCAEAVNFAPADWLPHGTDVLKKYREQKKPTTFSHDSLLINLVSSIRSHIDLADGVEDGDHSKAEIDPVTIKYAVGELSLRIREEERRRAIAFKEGIDEEQRMKGRAKERDGNGLIVNTEDMDCEFCRCDLYLSAVISGQKPNSVMCPEHAHCLPAPRTLIYRYEVNELQEMIDSALKVYPDCKEFVVQAFRRVNSQNVSSLVKHGPIYSDSTCS